MPTVRKGSPIISILNAFPKEVFLAPLHFRYEPEDDITKCNTRRGER
jgi:hypothetical protein